MNVPRVAQTALSGFIIPPRTFMQMMVSACRGAMGLINIDNRTEFIEKLDKGTINERVMSQTTAGPMLMLSLFHDLQNPLFKRYKFDAHEFLEGMVPALERFHTVSAALDNELIQIKDESDKNTTATSENNQEDKVNKNKSKKNTSSQQQSSDEIDGLVQTKNADGIAAVFNHDWMDIAEKQPESLAGQLSRMVTTELFSLLQSRTKASFLISGVNNVAFKEGACTVNNVALLSARAYMCVEREGGDDVERWGPRSDRKYEIIDYDMEEEELKKKKGGVAAQLEVLYDVTQSFVELKSSDSSSIPDKEIQELDLTTVSVVVMEGWLLGGPDDQLRWKLALHRPALEFPGVQVSMTL